MIKEAYVQGEDNEIDQETSDQIRPKDVGHNIYILAHQVRFKCSQQNTVCFTSDSSISVSVFTSTCFLDRLSHLLDSLFLSNWLLSKWHNFRCSSICFPNTLTQMTERKCKCAYSSSLAVSFPGIMCLMANSCHSFRWDFYSDPLASLCFEKLWPMAIWSCWGGFESFGPSVQCLSVSFCCVGSHL